MTEPKLDMQAQYTFGQYTAQWTSIPLTNQFISMLTPLPSIDLGENCAIIIVFHWAKSERNCAEQAMMIVTLLGEYEHCIVIINYDHEA